MNYTSYRNEKLAGITKGGKFFDFTLKSGHPAIFDYVQAPEIIVDVDGKITFGGVKEKKEIVSIQGLRETFTELITDTLNIVNQNGTYNIGVDVSNLDYRIEPKPFRVNIRKEDMEFLVDQLVFDILFCKYFVESPQLTLQQYSLTHRGERWGSVIDDKLIVDTVRKCTSAAARRQADIFNSPALRRDIEKLGWDPDTYFEYITEFGTPFVNGAEQKIVTKPKFVWDQLYYNGTQKLITGKQFARSFSKNNNYTHSDIVKMFDTYDRFVDNVFMREAQNGKDYFMKSLDFYALEIYKRIDFIYKLAVRLDSPDAPIISKNHPLVKRFHPEVIAKICFNADSQCFGTEYRYYRPMLMLEDLWQQQKRYEEADFSDMMIKHQFIRAKVYELFRYHYKFESNDYEDIAKFIRERYNVLAYHESSKAWIQPDRRLKREREARVIKALKINEALFGDVSRRCKIWLLQNVESEFDLNLPDFSHADI